MLQMRFDSYDYISTFINDILIYFRSAVVCLAHIIDVFLHFLSFLQKYCTDFAYSGYYQWMSWISGEPK